MSKVGDLPLVGYGGLGREFLEGDSCWRRLPVSREGEWDCCLSSNGSGDGMLVSGDGGESSNPSKSCRVSLSLSSCAFFFENRFFLDAAYDIVCMCVGKVSTYIPLSIIVLKMLLTYQ